MTRGTAATLSAEKLAWDHVVIVRGSAAEGEGHDRATSPPPFKCMPANRRHHWTAALWARSSSAATATRLPEQAANRADNSRATKGRQMTRFRQGADAGVAA